MSAFPVPKCQWPLRLSSGHRTQWREIITMKTKANVIYGPPDHVEDKFYRGLSILYKAQKYLSMIHNIYESLHNQKENYKYKITQVPD